MFYCMIKHLSKATQVFLCYFSFLLWFKMALRTMASKLATTIPFEKNIWKAVGKLLKRLLLLRPTPAAIDTAAIKKLCCFDHTSTRVKICIP